MRAAVLDQVHQPLAIRELPLPNPAKGQVRIRVEACGVCRTDLHLMDGELPDYRLPMTPGHQVIGKVERVGPGTCGLKVGQRVGVPWLGWTCGECEACLRGQENLCPHAQFTGCHIAGGFAEYLVADARYCFELPEDIDAERLAPLMCAGMIGYRALRMAGDGRVIGLYGFGSAAHILAQVLRFQNRNFIAVTRPGDVQSISFARSLGAMWAGSSDEVPPVLLDAAIIFAPDGRLVPLALKHLHKGGRIVCAGIHMSDIPGFPYADLWGERSIISVANLTRADGIEFLRLATSIPIRAETHCYGLDEVNGALSDLRSGIVSGSAVIRFSDTPNC